MRCGIGHRVRIRALVVIALAFVLTVAGSAAATEREGTAALSPKPLSGLRILLTNDDSVGSTVTRGRGLWELRKALCAEGADVIVVGPATAQSGMGTRMSTGGRLTTALVSPPAGYGEDCADAPNGGLTKGVNASSPAGASPGDTVSLALSAGDVLPDGWHPDLVMSGTNFGQNIGVSVNHSGTVSAAIAALEHTVPAIAMSAEIACAPGPDFSFPCVDFAGAGGFAARLVERLRATASRGESLLPHGVALNVNYPANCSPTRLCETTFSAGEAAMTVVGDRVDSQLIYSGSDGVYEVGIVICGRAECPENRRHADTTALAKHHVSISPLNGDWTVPASDGFAKIGARLRNLS